MAARPYTSVHLTSLTSPPIHPSARATLAFLLFFKHTENALTSRPFHLVFPLARCASSKYPLGSHPLILQTVTQMSLPQRSLPRLLFQNGNYPLLHHHQCLSSLFIPTALIKILSSLLKCLVYLLSVSPLEFNSFLLWRTPVCSMQK